MDHPGRLCRLCAQPSSDGQFFFLFSNEDELDPDNLFQGVDIAEVINISLPIKVSRTDPLPKQLCHSCVEKLQAVHEFAMSCLVAEEELNRLSCELKFGVQDSLESKRREQANTASIWDNENESDIQTELFGEKSTIGLKQDLEMKMEEMDTDFHDVESENLCATDYCCPLCCEGKMNSCDKPSEIVVDDSEDDAIDFQDELLAQYREANMTCSDKSVDDDEEVMEDELSEDILNEDERAEEEDDVVALPELPSKPIERKVRGRKKKYKKRGRPRGKTKPKGDPEDSDTLIWVKAEDEESVPLVQCVQCSGWLPGYASCLQHAVNSHIIPSESGSTSYHCPRCEALTLGSQSELLQHFNKLHCPSLDLKIEEENGEVIVVSRTLKKISSDARRFRNVAYHCTICQKGFAWLLAFLRHSCMIVDCSNMHCKICDQPYRNRQRFVFHMQFHSPTAPPLQCDVCNQSFESDNLLYDHVRFAHLEENIVCDECGKHFRSEKGLVSHQQSAHNANPAILNRHKCSQCGKGYRDKQGLREHVVTHMSEKPFPCDKCDRAYNRYSRLKQHQMSHLYTDSMNCWECTSCGRAFPDQENALQHSVAEQHEVQEATLTKVFRCEFCDTVFSFPDGLNQHRLQHVGEKPYVCHICGTAFHTYSRVTTHKTTHGIYDQIGPQEGDFTIAKHFLCEHCGLSYPYWGYLQTHRKMRHSENPFTLSCKLCPEKFRNSWSLVYHRKKVHDENGVVREWKRRSLQCPYCGVNCMYQHTLDVHIERKHGPSKNEDAGRESYQCEECGKVFKYQSSLILHQKMHQGQKNFQCEQCEKSFLTVATLRNHTKRCHQGIKPHQCEFCGKAFFHKVTRDDHLRVHTGEKPFKCQFCDKSFRLKSMLSDHVKIHNDHRPYPCDVCGSSFRRVVHMKQHRMLHTGEKPFHCDICQQDFRLKQELQRHQRTKHDSLASENVEEEEFILP